MNKNFLVLCLVIFFSAGIALASKTPQTVRTALAALGKQVEGEPLKQVVQVKGFHGQDQPEEWRVVLFQPEDAGKFHLYRMRAGEVVGSEELTGQLAAKLPGGVVPYDKVLIDSAEVFTIADREAKKAKVGFDSVSYELRCRELSQDPVWYVDLRDQRDLAVGRLYVSAIDGGLMGKVWYPQSPAAATDPNASNSADASNPNSDDSRTKGGSPFASMRRGLAQVSGKVVGVFSRAQPASTVQ